MKNFLLIPRFLLLLFLYLFVLVGIASILSQDSPVPGIVVAIICGLLLYRIKSSNFLIPSDRQIDSLNNIKMMAISKKEEIVNSLEYQRLELEKRKKFIENFRGLGCKDPFEFVVLGGIGWDRLAGIKHIISINDDTVFIGNLTTFSEVKIPICNVIDIDITGPGTVSSNAGISGGGFGFDGAIKGIAIATVVNLLTTYSSTKTIVRIGYDKSEIVFITSKIEPEQARLYFSSIFVKIRTRLAAGEQPISIGSELTKLLELKNSGVLTENEFNQAKAKILGE